MAPTRPTIDRTKAPLTDPNVLPTDHVTMLDWYPISFTVDPARLLRMIMQAPSGIDNASIAMFMSSQIDDLENSRGSQWEAHRVLGQGGFGTVGYWRKLNNEGDTIDELAIKEQTHSVPHGHISHHFGETMTMRERGIAEEAVFHAGLQVKEATAQAAIGDDGFANEVERSGHIPPLRAYKYLEQPKTSRMYLCFAPHGTLQDILWLYAANNQNVPETFAWTVMLSVALMLQQQHGALPESSVLYQFRQRPRDERKDWIVHLDIKPLNVLLDYAPISDRNIDAVLEMDDYPDDPTSLYPRVWLNDYGLAIDNDRHGTIIPPGWSTEGWRAPELLRGMRAHTEDKPNPNLTPTGVATDIWVLAKMVYDLVTGAEPRKMQDDLYRVADAEGRGPIPEGEEDPIEEGEVPQDGAHWNGKDTLVLPGCYSSALAKLLTECLHMEADQRPDIDEVVRISKLNLNRSIASYNQSSSSDFKKLFRLYYRDGELDQLAFNSSTLTKRPPLVHRYYLRRVKYRNPEVSVNFDPRVWGTESERRRDDESPMVYKYFHRRDDGMLEIKARIPGRRSPAPANHPPADQDQAAQRQPNGDQISPSPEFRTYVPQYRLRDTPSEPSFSPLSSSNHFRGYEEGPASPPANPAVNQQPPAVQPIPGADQHPRDPTPPFRNSGEAQRHPRTPTPPHKSPRAAQQPPRDPTPSPQNSPPIQSTDPDVQEWVGRGIKSIRARLRELDSTKKGTKKLQLAKAVVDIERKAARAARAAEAAGAARAAARDNARPRAGRGRGRPTARRGRGGGTNTANGMNVHT